MSNFIEYCCVGTALPSEINEYIDFWHSNQSSDKLHEYLGMTKEEYARWMKDPSVLESIIKSRKESLSL